MTKFDLTAYATYYSFTNQFPPKPEGISQARYNAACNLAKSFLVEAGLV